MILTSNRGFAEWADVFGDPVVATALLDRLLHHAVVVQIAIHGDEIGRILAQRTGPGHKTGREQRWVNTVHQDIKPAP